VIDRKTALRCAALIVLMLVMAVWRIITLEHWTIAGENGAPLSSLWLLLFPASSAFFVGVLYWAGQEQTPRRSNLGANGELSSQSAIAVVCYCCRLWSSS
jgi:hypothetical protein